MMTIPQENQELAKAHSPWRLSVAPMMDWTDKGGNFL